MQEARIEQQDFCEAINAGVSTDRFEELLLG
jgi:hypothetical protein